MALCPYCGLAVPDRMGQCPHHEIGEDRWAEQNARICDLLHRGKEATPEEWEADRKRKEGEPSEETWAGFVQPELNVPTEERRVRSRGDWGVFVDHVGTVRQVFRYLVNEAT